MSVIEKAIRRGAGEGESTRAPARTAGESRALDIARMRMPPPWPPTALEARRLIYPGMKDVRMLNAFRLLRTRLFSVAGCGRLTIAVTGVARGGGASFAARNLAAALAMDAIQTVLLVDANLRCPGLDDLLAEPGDGPVTGLTDYLAGRIDDPAAIIHATGVPRLRLIPVGTLRTDAVESMSMTRLHELFSHLRARYPDRNLVLDLPPILDEADARILAGLADTVVLAVRYGRDAAHRVQVAADVIPSERFGGIVFNDEPVAPAAWG